MKKFKWWDEDAPTNATGATVAGTGDDSSTVVVKKQPKIYRRKKRKIDMEAKRVDEARRTDAVRNYRKEYDNYHSQPEQRERNAARLRARRQMEKWGKVKKFDKKDVHHKDNNPLNNEKDNLAVTTQTWNRTEPRLRKEELDEAVSVKEFDSLKKGDTVTIEYKSAMSSGKATFKVTAKNVVGKARVEKVTLQSIKNPRGVKHFLYKRSTGVTFAQGDMGSQVISFKKEEVMNEAGRPRGAARIENERFWDLKDEELRYIIKDAGEAVIANPTAKKATQGPGNWSDQINDAATVLAYRKKKNIKIEEVEESINIQERELTPTELKRREEIAKDLNDADFKKRYGDRWKEVKMGVATNMAKKESVNEQDDPKADKAKAKELKIAKAIAQAQLAIAKEQERVQKLTDLQKKVKDQASEETIMNKKYLETKTGSLEESAYEVWERSMPRQLKDPKKEMLVVKNNVVVVIDKKEWKKMKKMGWMPAESYTPEEEKKEETTSAKVDGRTKAYKEAIRRIKMRQERNKAKSKPVTEESIDEAQSGDKEAYKKFFDAALKKFGIDSPADLKSDEEKKKFYDYIDKNWEGDDEKKESVEFSEKIEYVEYQFRNKNEAMAAKKFFDGQQRMGFEINDDNISNGELAVDAGKNDMTKYHEAIVKKLKPKVVTKENEKKKVNDEEDEDENPVGKSYNEAVITVTFDVQDGAKFKNTLGDHGLRGKKVKGDGGVRGDSVEVKGDPKKLKKLAKDDERGSGNILRIHDNGQLKLVEAAIDDLRKIVKTKSMGKVSGTKVDLFSASAMVQVYDALNDKNRAKVDKMLKDKRGVMTFADFAMSQMK